ncbi:hypothetical protein Dda_1843 [Drechslerella dactyloides]|uniref:Nucleoside transporter n=1 Tax=Drechslerella dactyloides TaxID=74499 RepID=A0AAD6J6Q9_DREDA|nr:hypothetical protein Dda_1843 [Drechslerella dactyloides]
MVRLFPSFRYGSRSKRSVNYTPLADEHEHEHDGTDAEDQDPPSMTSSAVLLSPRVDKDFDRLSSIMWFDYTVFLVLGVAMLWAWNCFLAAAAYFQGRFRDNKTILDTFQSSIMTVSTVTTLLTTLALSHLQRTAHYPRRITSALIINIVVFILLALSTILFTGISAGAYLAFTLCMVLSTAMAAGFFQNGLFAYVGPFGPIYAQAVMAGQGVAGVLPAIAQMVSVLAIPPRSPEEEQAQQKSGKPPPASPKSAFAYFLTATAVSGAALFLFFILLSRHTKDKEAQNGSVRDSSHPIVDELAEPDAIREPRKHTSILTLLRKLPLPAFTIFFTFALTMVFPVFTQATLSVNPPSSSAIARPEVFIPFAFLVWNCGDLVGRVICGIPGVVCRNPQILATAAAARVLWIPLYLLCNVKGRGARVNSDWFYWAVQVTFGVTNGYIGSSSMMLGPTLVEDDEVAAAGGFMGLCLVAGLAAGSAASFLLSL